MLSFDASRTREILKVALSEEALLDRRYLRYEKAAAAGSRELTEFLRAAAKDRVACANGHLDYLLAGDGTSSTDPMRRSGAELAAAITAMTDDHVAMYAAMARTARDEGFEEIADWFETLAKSGRSRARRPPRLAENTR